MTHYRLLFSLKNEISIKYYIDLCIKQKLSYRELKQKIKSKEYERLPESAKLKLINNEDITTDESIIARTYKLTC